MNTDINTESEGNATEEHSDPTDIDVSGLAGDALAVENQLRDHFRATSAQIDTGDLGGVTLRLTFQGFASLEAAIERVGEAARDLEALAETETVDMGASTEFGHDYAVNEFDDRPSGWVNATLDKRSGEATEGA